MGDVEQVTERNETHLVILQQQAAQEEKMVQEAKEASELMKQVGTSFKWPIRICQRERLTQRSSRFQLQKESSRLLSIVSRLGRSLYCHLTMVIELTLSS